MAIEYPYLPAGRIIKYVPEDHPHMQAAKEFARQNNTVRHIHAAVLAKDGRIIGRGSIGAGYHGGIDSETRERRGCVREHLNVPTGTQYELCEGCGYEYHSEASAVRDAQERGEATEDSELYLWGHWWACEPCWNAMIEAGVKDVYLMEKSEELFNKSHPDNIVGRQFEE